MPSFYESTATFRGGATEPKKKRKSKRTNEERKETEASSNERVFLHIFSFCECTTYFPVSQQIGGPQ